MPITGMSPPGKWNVTAICSEQAMSRTGKAVKTLNADRADEVDKATAPASRVSRISISLPETLLQDLDAMVDDRGFESRSQAICDLITQGVNEHRQEWGESIMTGTVNLVFRHDVPGLQSRLLELQHSFIDEVISSLNVNLADSKTLSVILVQGPAATLKRIADQMITLRGVLSGRLLLSAAIIPPIHPLPEAPPDGAAG